MIAVSAGPAAAAGSDRDFAVVRADGPGHVSLQVLDSTGAVRRTLVESIGALECPTWSPDGSKIAYEDGSTYPERLKVVAATGGAPTDIGEGTCPAWSPSSNEIAAWSTLPSGDRSLGLISSDGARLRTLIVGSSRVLPLGNVSWARDGQSLAILGGDGIYRLPTNGGDTTPIALALHPSPRDPAFSPDGLSLAYVDGRGLVVRTLTEGTERVIGDSINSQPTWSADSQRIAGFHETLTPNIQYFVSIAATGGDLRTLGTADTAASQRFVGAQWDTSARSYFVKGVEVAQAISPDLELAPSDPLQSDPYAFAWNEPEAFNLQIPLIAEKSTLLRVYVGDANAPGETERRSIRYRVTDPARSKRYEGTQDVDVTAPGVAPQQARAAAAINVWVPPEAAKSGETHNLEVEINADQTEQECTGCYPNGNRATVQGISFQEGGNVVLAPVPISVVGPKDQINPDAGLLKFGVGEAVAALPVRDRGVTFVGSPGSLLVDQKDLTPEHGCDLLLAKLLELRATRGIAGPVEGFGAARWVGYAPIPAGASGPDFCSGKSELPGRNLVVLGTDPANFAHELGHSLGLAHVTGHQPQEASFQRGAISLPYSPGIGGVGYTPEIARILNVFDKATTGDLMSYDATTWTSPKTWLTMYEKILAESRDVPRGAPRSASGSQRNTAAGRSSAAAHPPIVRRLVTGVASGGNSVIYDSVVTEATNPASPGSPVARVLAQDHRGHTVAQATVRGTPYAEKGEKQPALPFVVALPNRHDIASLELLPIHGGKALVWLRRSKHSPSGRLLRLPKRASAAKLLRIRWGASDRDRSDKLTVLLLARRGAGKWRTVALGPAKGTVALDLKTVGRGKKLSLRLGVSDGLRTTVVNARAVALR